MHLPSSHRARVGLGAAAVCGALVFGLVAIGPPSGGNEAPKGDGSAVAPVWLGSSLGPQEPVVGGWQRRYEGGILYYSPGSGVNAIANGAILTAYRSAGGPGSDLGFPTTDELPVPSGGRSPGSQAGHVVHLQRGLISAATAADAVTLSGPEATAYERVGGPTGRLGLPVAAPTAVGAGRMTAFAGGAMYVLPSGQAWSVIDPLRSDYQQRGGAGGQLGWPTADSTVTGDGLSATFEGGTLQWAAATGAVTLSPVTRPGGAKPPTAAAGAPARPTLITTAPNAVTPSYYVTVVPGSNTATERSRSAGCADARGGVSGVRVLDFGAQQTSGIRRPGLPSAWSGEHLSYDAAAAIAKAWIQGFVDCRAAGVGATFALGTNNHPWTAPVPGAQAGARWARFVDGVASWAEGRYANLRVVGANDIEPAWGTAADGRAWVGSYVKATSRPMLAYASADGCPASGAARGCMNGWTVEDVYYIATGAGPGVYAVPQIYRADGAMARQWARISEWGVAHGKGQVRFAGVMSQQAACGVNHDCGAGTNAIDIAPATAWQQLNGALAAGRGTATRLPGPTDITWMR